MNLLILLARTTLTFTVLLIMTRLLGKKQVSHLTFFNYVTGITIGSIAANIISFPDRPITEDLIGLIWWCTLTALTGYISLKSGKIRSIVDGQPTILIKKGQIEKKALMKSKLNMDDLSVLLREQNIFSVTEVEYAILEPHGKLSVMRKAQERPVTKTDLNIAVQANQYMPSEIIVDGKIVKQNLKEYNLDEKWLQ